jgi:hypothetical protein
VKTKSFSISNPSDQSREVELKTWIALPALLPISLNVAADADDEDVLVLDPGLNREYAVPSALEISPEAPLQSARIGTRLLDPVTGRILSEDINPFCITLSSACGRREPGRNRFVEAKPDVTLESIVEDGLPQFILRNNGETPASVELKLWLETADGTQDALLSSGADGLLVLPAGAVLMVSPLASMEIPAGDHVVRARLLDPSSGEILSEK